MAIRDLFSRKQVCHFLVTDEGEIAKKYNHFMEFLTNNRAALGIISELEQLYYGSGPFTMAGVEDSIRQAGGGHRQPGGGPERLGAGEV